MEMFTPSIQTDSAMRRESGNSVVTFFIRPCSLSGTYFVKLKSTTALCVSVLIKVAR